MYTQTCLPVYGKMRGEVVCFAECCHGSSVILVFPRINKFIAKADGILK